MKRLLLAVLALAASTCPSLAHLDPDEHGSLLAGLSHPLFGVDHILAMVTVGLWAALLGGSAIWLVPAAFVGTMALGYIAALAGLVLPFVEPAILASVVVLGLLVAIAARLPVAIAMAIVAVFAFFHGYAHGGELGTAGRLPYGLGFAASTTLLHLVGAGSGIALLAAFGASHGRAVSRIVGAAAAAGGCVLAFGS